MSRISGIALVILFSVGLCSQGTARAGEVKLLSALVMKPALAELAASFERTGGHKLTIAYDSAGAVAKRIQSGETADVAIIQRPTIERLIKEGKIVSGSNVTLARSGVAIAVRQGAPKPDIGSVDALKRTLLEAKSIAYPVPDAGHAERVPANLARWLAREADRKRRSTYQKETPRSKSHTERIRHSRKQASANVGTSESTLAIALSIRLTQRRAIWPSAV